MSNIGFNCDVCGRMVQGCTIVNGMKFCAKCYQETFGNDYSQVDIINAQYTEHLLKENVQSKEKIESLGQENKQLEEQLAEKDKEIEKLRAKLEQSIGLKITMICEHNKDIQKIRKQVCDKIKKVIEYHSEWYEQGYVINMTTEDLLKEIDKIYKEKIGI